MRQPARPAAPVKAGRRPPRRGRLDGRGEGRAMIANPDSEEASMPRGRPPYGFLLIDLPSDHEIEGNIVRGCQVIGAILHNRNLGSVTKIVTATTGEKFKEVAQRSFERVGFVHLAAHGDTAGIGLIGGEASWATVAARLRKMAPKLGNEQERVLCLSCCYSAKGIERLTPMLKGHFTHAYHFAHRRVGFATAMTVWSMFYRKKTLDRPLKAVVDPINDFFGAERIVFREL